MAERYEVVVETGAIPETEIIEMPTGVPVDAGSDENEYERFEDLAQRLIAVPKSEVDEERAKSERA